MGQVIVFGKDGYNTLGLVRSLGHRGVSVFLLLQRSSVPSYCGLSKYITSKRKVSTIQEGIEYLQTGYKPMSNNKTVVIPTSDLIASELDKHLDLLSSKYIFPNAGSQGCLNKIMDKYYMTILAEQSGLRVPFSIEYSCGQPIPEKVVFPCMVKPAKSINGSKKEMRICWTTDDLYAATSYQSKGHQLLIQQYIKRDYDILLLGSRSSNGKTLLAGVFKKLRWFSMGNDGSFGKITTSIDQWVERNAIDSFLQRLNYVGPFSIEFGVENGVPYFFEINLRNDGTSHYFDATGFCNSYAWVRECEGHNINENKGSSEYWFIDEFGDFLNVVAGIISFKQWRKDLKAATAFKYKDPTDNRPMFVIRPYMVALIAKNALNVLKNKCKKSNIL